jgi:hypothetical protein
VCAARITQGRAEEVTAAVEHWRIERVAMLTLTVRHHAGERLRTLRAGLMKAWKFCQQGKAWIELRERASLQHWIRVVEVTHGQNGWHAHIHALLFCDRVELAIGELDVLRDRWARCVERAIGAEHLPNRTRGIDLRPCRRAGYLFDLGLQMAIETGKTSRHGNRSAWQIARDLAAGGAEADAVLWREYTAGMKAAQQLRWSSGFRELVKLGRFIPDTESVEQDAPAKQAALLATIPRETWREYASKRHAIANLHRLVSMGGERLAIGYLVARTIGADPASVSWEGVRLRWRERQDE